MGRASFFLVGKGDEVVMETGTSSFRDLEAGEHLRTDGADRGRVRDARASAARSRRSLFSTQPAYERPALVMSAFSAVTESVAMSPSVGVSVKDRRKGFLHYGDCMALLANIYF